MILPPDDHREDWQVLQDMSVLDGQEWLWMRDWKSPNAPVIGYWVQEDITLCWKIFASCSSCFTNGTSNNRTNNFCNDGGYNNKNDSSIKYEDNHNDDHDKDAYDNDPGNDKQQ